MTIDNTRTHSPLEQFIDSLADKNLTYYASDLMHLTGCASMDELGVALRRATEVCTCMHIPLRENFKVVFRPQNGEMVQDWRLSPMAYMLLVLNSEAHNDLVAHLQVEMVKRALNQE
ncbi:hypothetical protein K0O23_18110 [Pontibacter aydingkolensis]|uniref:Uncharacterized protein n=2 Tax=Pontibacter aydingkolensis TaxID=1911536 RepID=A0ABS7CYR1_9BACT|nr:hypothetical protein [Pontibacter aydingkolensis]